MNLWLSPEVPLEILSALDYMLTPINKRISEPEYITRSKNKLFESRMWKKILISEVPHFPFRYNSQCIYYHVFNKYALSINSSFIETDKEYDLFLEWLLPYIFNEDLFLGYYRYYTDKYPTLIYRENGKINYEKKFINY
jgi:hypothetical protein